MTRVRIDPARLGEVLGGEDGPVAKELLRAALKVERTAKRLCPVDTGRLRASITHRLERDQLGLSAVVGTDVHYVIYQEFGTSRMPAHPFLRPALEALRS